MSEIFLQLLHEEGRTQINKGTKRHDIVAFFPEIPKSHTVNVYCCRLLLTQSNEPVMFSVLQHNTFTVQILYKLYSLYLNCTYSNYTEAAATCSAAQQHRNSQADVF